MPALYSSMSHLFFMRKILLPASQYCFTLARLPPLSPSTRHAPRPSQHARALDRSHAGKFRESTKGYRKDHLLSFHNIHHAALHGRHLRSRHRGSGYGQDNVLLWLQNGNDIRQRLLGASPAGRVPRQHNLDLDAQHPLPKHDVAVRVVHILLDWVARRDHVAVDELHRLGPLRAELARHGDLAALGARLHHKPEDTIAGAAHSKATNQLVTQRLSLRNRAQAPVVHLLHIQLDGTLRELEPLLHNGGELTDPATLLAQHRLRACRTDNNLGADGGDAHLHARVALLGQLARQQLVELSVQDAIGDKLALLRHSHSRHDGYRFAAGAGGAEGGKRYKDAQARRWRERSRTP
eukprot:contig_7116_g1650